METQIVTTITEQLPETIQTYPLNTTVANGLEVYLNDSGDFMQNTANYLRSTVDYINNILTDTFNVCWYYVRYVSGFLNIFADDGLPWFLLTALSASLFFMWYSFLRGR